MVFMENNSVRILAEKAAELYNANSSVSNIQQANAVVESLKMFIQAYEMFAQAYQVYDDVYSKPHPIWKPKIFSGAKEIMDDLFKSMDDDNV